MATQNILSQPPFLSISRHFSSPFYHECDTCDSKKTKSLLEGARATRARTPTRVNLHLPHSIRSTYSPNLLHFLSHHSTNIAPNDTPQCLLIAQKINRPTRHNIFSPCSPSFFGFIGAYIHRRCHHKVQQSFPSFLFHHLNI